MIEKLMPGSRTRELRDKARRIVKMEKRKLRRANNLCPKPPRPVLEECHHMRWLDRQCY